MRVLGLTGGIGTGKSLVAGMIREAGIPVVDADRISREVLEPGTPAHAEVVGRFGPEIVDPSGRIDRKRLGGIVFSDPERRALLESIVLPRIRAGIDEALARLDSEGCPAAFVEAAMILENRREGFFESILCVWCDLPTQLRRIMERDGVSREEAMRRISSQMDASEKARRSDRVIDNSGAPGETRARVEELLAELGLSRPRPPGSGSP